MSISNLSDRKYWDESGRPLDIHAPAIDNIEDHRTVISNLMEVNVVSTDTGTDPA